MDKKDLSNDMEMRFLENVEGINQEQFQKQISGETSEEPTKDTPPADTPTDTPSAQEPTGNQAPPASEKPTSTEPPKFTDEQISEQRNLFMKEIFGDKFNSVDDIKNANIPGVLTEVESLRQANTELQEKLDTKPKTNFADDEVALYNEFVKDTGHKDYGLFKKINSDLANMSDMDAIVANYVLNIPNAAGRESEVRAHFEKKYGYDSEEEKFENDFEMKEDAFKARKAMQDIKEKLKVPEPQSDEPSKPKELTPEQKETLTKGWNGAASEVTKALSKLKIPIKGKNEALLDYEIPESELQSVAKFITDNAVGNRMEPNEQNVRSLGMVAYNQLIVNNLENIVHSVFEKARSLSEEQYSEMFHNPSTERNTDKPDITTDTRTDEDKAFDQTMKLEFGE